MLKITLKRSYIGKPEKHRRILRSLGLRKIGHTVYKPDVPSIRGMINKVPHLIEVEEVPDEKS
ncbi:MAG: 50S ribosomal protein L30 [Nitrospirae bacterium]|nr:50S ribosomal protein L30 [Nitrospirota bacterium]